MVGTKGAADNVGSWRATSRATGVLHGGSDVLQHPARAVVPPPRLRAKWVVFSAHLRTTLAGAGWMLARRFERRKNLRIPARADVTRNAYKHAWTAEFSRYLGKKVSFFLGGGLRCGRSVFVRLET